MKVALVHDWLTGMRGGEKCLEVFCELFPDADLFTLIHVPGRVSPRIEQHRIITSFLQDLPGHERWYRYYLPLMPAAIEALDLSPYDVVLSSSHCAAKGVIPRPDALHVSYIHTPMRYAWDLWPQYFPPKGWVSRYVLPVLLNRLRTWDTVSTHRVDHLVANSRFVAQRIAKYYRREATVIHPPVDTAWFTPAPADRDGPANAPANFYLMVTALVPNKRVDLAIEAFNELRRPLKIIGSGPLETRLKRLAGPTIEMLGWCSDEVLRQAYATCKAVVFPSQEDFGIVPLEANAAGRPVIALGQGGSLETVVPANRDHGAGPPTGVFFGQLSAVALAEAVRFFETHEAVFDPAALRQHALQFDRQQFKQRIRQFLHAAWAARDDSSVRNGPHLAEARCPNAQHGVRMLKKHSQFFENLLFLFDLAVIYAAWFAAYGLRFSGWPIPVYYGVAPLENYLFLCWFMPLVWGLIFKSMNMYRPRRISSHLTEAYDVLKATTVAVGLLMVVTYIGKQETVSRILFGYFWCMSCAGLIGSRLLFRELLRFARRRGYNLRHILILGTDELAQSLFQDIRRHPELGFNVVGFLTGNVYEVGQRLHGVEVLGHIDQVKAFVRSCEVDQIFIALPLEAMSALEKILKQLNTEMVDIKIVPDLYQHVILQGSVEEFAGHPIVTLSGSPMYGWNQVIKRLFDLAVTIPLLIVGLPVFVAIAALVKATSRGPVFYTQERMGYDGRILRMIKFRTMHEDAERDTGEVWAQKDDPRRTRLGAVLRRTSLDELPQLWNVLKGEMSLVGPRPERPVFVEEFRHRFPRYMLRHRVKAGMTGWAQVQGWRGNTSLEKRLEHDLYYIQHWSLLLDIKILWLTLWRGFVNPNAY